MPACSEGQQAAAEGKSRRGAASGDPAAGKEATDFLFFFGLVVFCVHFAIWFMNSKKSKTIRRKGARNFVIRQFVLTSK